jgi:putative ABC transport system substrate-binding protein
MRRRTFIAGVGSSWLWPRLTRAQDRDRQRHIGALMNFRKEDPEGQARVAAFLDGLRKLGWTEGDNLFAEILWAGDDQDLSRKYAQDLVDARPEAIMASALASVAALKRLTQTIPIIFANLIDPIGSGMVSSMSHPGGNITGFTAFDYSLAGKWLEFLQEFAPRLTTVAVVEDPSSLSGIGQFAAIQAFGASSKLDFSVIDPRDRNAIAAALAVLSRQPNPGVVVTANSSVVTQRDLLIPLAIRYRLPAVYPFPYYAHSGGLMAFGPDTRGVYSRAATYVDKVLRGAHPQDLPVQAPDRFQLVVNVRTAKTMSLDVPSSLLARADEVIE